jgi:Tfp pilus assembly protein PilO
MTARDRKLLGGVLVLVLLAGAWFVLIAPRRDEASSLADQIAQAEQRRDAAVANAMAAEAARAAYRTDYATVARLGKAVPQNADVPSVVYQLETAARRAKVDFRSVRVESVAPTAPAPVAPAATGATSDPAAPAAAAAATTTTSGITPVPFTFTFDGDYFALRRFLSAVDRFSRVRGGTVSVSGRLLTLDSVSLSPGRKGLPHVKAEVTAKAYVAPMPGELPATASTTTPPPAGTPAVAAPPAQTAQVTP